LTEYKEFNKTQPIESDFDKVIKKWSRMRTNLQNSCNLSIIMSY
jgi:hypothetical protein